MPHSTGQLVSRRLLAVLAFASPLLAQANEGKLAPVIDLNPRYLEAASPLLEEPKSLIVAAEAMPLPAAGPSPTAPLTKPTPNSTAGHKPSTPQPAVHYVVPFDPTGAEIRAPQMTARTSARQDSATTNARTSNAERLAPVIRVYEPIRPAQHPRFDEAVAAARGNTQPSKPIAAPSPMPEAVYRSIFLATRTDRLQRANTPRSQPVERHDLLVSRMLETLDSLPHQKPVASATNHVAAPPNTADQPSAAIAPQRSGFIQIAERDPVSGAYQQTVPRELTLDGAAALPQPTSPAVDLAINPIVSPSPTITLAPQPAIASKPERVVKLAEEASRERPAPSGALVQKQIPATTALPVVQFADAQPLLTVLQPSPSPSDLPSPQEELPPTEEAEVAEAIKSFELNVKPINELSLRTKPEAGELPTDYAATRFAREGEVAHRMGFSRSKMETTMMWEAPAICHRPLYFEEINLERHGYKVPVIQPALSAAHFFGRVPLLPYMMVSEGHRSCQYTLGHYRPGDYAPYSLYVPRLRLDASAAEAAVVAGVIFAFP